MNDHACCINRAEGSVSGTPGQTDTRTCSKAVPLPRLLNIYLQCYGVTVTVFHVYLACSLKIRYTPCLFFFYYFDKHFQLMNHRSLCTYRNSAKWIFCNLHIIFSRVYTASLLSIFPGSNAAGVAIRVCFVLKHTLD